MEIIFESVYRPLKKVAARSRARRVGFCFGDVVEMKEDFFFR